MKIGILTLDYITNYGGILQTLALQNYLTEMNYEVEIIHFRRTKKTSRKKRLWYLFGNIISGRTPIKRFFEKKPYNTKGVDSKKLIERNRLFIEQYLKRSTLTDEDNIGNLCKKYDCVVVGSDQIWSVTDGEYLTYFFDWKFDGKKIAYAACSVNPLPSFFNRKKIAGLLADFDAISVRDETTLSFCNKSLYTRDYHLVVDPTFLYDFSYFHFENKFDFDYIFVYILGSEICGGNKAAIEQLKKIYKCEKVVSVIIPSVSTTGTIGADIIICDATPNEWLNLIRHAKAVFTDSFHGCVFSMKYNVPLIAYYSLSYRASRLLDLKKRFSVRTIISSVEEIPSEAECFVYNRKELANAITDSKQFMLNSLK